MNIISVLLSFRNQIIILHWQTNSFAQHEALGKLYEGMDGLIDEFIETLMGKKGRIFSASSFSINLKNISDYPPHMLIKDMREYLSNNLPAILNPSSDSDLLNIRDEMLALINKTDYLLTLQ